MIFGINKFNMHTGTVIPLSPQAQSQNACGRDSQRDTDEEESLYVQDDDDALMQIEEYGLEALFAKHTEHPGTNGKPGVENTSSTPEADCADILRRDSPVSTNSTQDVAMTVPQTNGTAQKSCHNHRKCYRPYCTTVRGWWYHLCMYTPAWQESKTCTKLCDCRVRVSMKPIQPWVLIKYVFEVNITESSVL